MTVALVIVAVAGCAVLAVELRRRHLGGDDGHRAPATHPHGGDRQDALLRVTGAVARGVRPERVCELVVGEVSALLDGAGVCIARIDSADSASVINQLGMTPDVHPQIGAVVRLPGDDPVVARVASTGKPVTLDSYPPGSGPRADYLRARFAEGAGVPVIAGSTMWGVLAVARANVAPPLPANVHVLLEPYAELIGLAMAGSDAQLRNSTATLLSTVFDAVPVGILVVDDDLRVVRVNEAATAHYGESIVGIVGGDLEKVFPPSITEMCRFGLRLGTGFEFTLLRDRARRPEARILTVDVRPCVEDDVAVGLVVITEDMTERRELEADWTRMREAGREDRRRAAIAARDLLAANEDTRELQRRLARQTELLAAVTALATDGIFAVDREGRFLLLNEVAATRLGTNREAAIGRSVDEFLPTEAASAIRAQSRSAVSGNAPAVFEYDIMGPGESARLLFVVAPYAVDGELLGLIGIARDVTDHRENERSMELLLARERAAQRVAYDSIRRLEEQNARLLELDHSKDEILALISHDLRTPLTSILGYAELFTKDGERVDPRHRRYVEVIARNGQKLVDLLDDLLLVAQYHAGGFALSPEHVDIGPLVIQCAEAAIPMAKAKHILVTHDVESHLTAFADPRRLVQLLDNLINNAIKYTDPQGFVDIAAHRADGKIVLRVRDNGPGIGLEEQRRIFERFTRARDAVRGGVRGFGLGLTIAHAIAEAHGGRIGVDSSPGTGSTFWVELDFVPEAGTSPAPGSVAASL